MQVIQREQFLAITGAAPSLDGLQQTPAGTAVDNWLLSSLQRGPKTEQVVLLWRLALVAQYLRYSEVVLGAEGASLHSFAAAARSDRRPSLTLAQPHAQVPSTCSTPTLFSSRLHRPV